MKILLKATYKSLDPFSSEELPNFCVITGKNGSGKTQLIELIQKKTENPNSNFEIDVDRLRIQVEGMNHPGANSLDPGMWNAKISEYNSDHYSKIHLMKAIQKLYMAIPAFSLLEMSQDQLEQLLTDIASVEIKLGIDHMNTFSDPSKTPIFHYARHAAEQILAKKESIEVAIMVAKKAKKDLDQISYQDFMRFPPDEKFIDRSHLFYSSIEKIFYSYAKRRHLNFNHWFANEKLNKVYDCMTDDEFMQKYPPPWKTINAIFKKHNINYSFEDISPDSFVEGISIDFKLIKNSIIKKVEFTSLSSGEKMIIALIVKLFAAAFYGSGIDRPELVVLDEPDSHLHPELSKLLIDVLSDTFVIELGIKVIITTHSPSTVALSPDESLFELRNEPTTSLSKISKDNALKLLTVGVPTLSIDYKNHRQVFVESPTDVFYYQNIYDVLSQRERFTFKPYFISYGKGQGNCDQVIQLVNNLRSSGNDKSYGVVDWDGKRIKSDFVLVHGSNARYSIENFIYDPIYLVEYFIEIGGAENVFSDLGFTTSYNQYALGQNEDNGSLQRISRWVIDRLRAKFTMLPGLEASKTQVEYLNGKQVDLPKWYVEMKGHELEEKLKKVFPSLAGKFRSEGQMQESLSKVIAKSYPFLPIETVKLIREIVR